MQKLIFSIVLLFVATRGANAACTIAGGECNTGTCNEGVDDGNSGLGVCDCSAVAFVGATCQHACPTAANCLNGGTCALNQAGDAAICQCVNNWSGADCGTCSPLMYGGETCELDCSGAPCTAPKECGKNKKEEGTVGTCVCAANKADTDCSKTCANDCTGNRYCGLATETATEGSCLCTDSYFGDDCDDKKCKDEGDEMCKNEGTCKDDVCECAEGYEGDRCADKKEEDKKDGASGVVAGVLTTTLGLVGVLLL